MRDVVISKFKASAALKTDFASKNWEQVAAVVRFCAQTLQSGNKIMLFGNGGSAADAQHIAAEFVNRLHKTRRARPPLAAIALTTDTSILTSISNDSDFSFIFSRQIQALGKPGDIAWGFSTSGNSPNLINAVTAAREMGIATLGFTGGGGGALGPLLDHHFTVESEEVTRIQEVHITLAHVICELIEEELHLNR
jgi:D-sedoheptulose 7-phosphate isomerase